MCSIGQFCSVLVTSPLYYCRILENGILFESFDLFFMVSFVSSNN